MICGILRDCVMPNDVVSNFATTSEISLYDSINDNLQFGDNPYVMNRLDMSVNDRKVLKTWDNFL